MTATGRLGAGQFWYWTATQSSAGVAHMFRLGDGKRGKGVKSLYFDVLCMRKEG